MADSVPSINKSAIDFIKILPTNEVILTKPYCEIEIPEEYFEHGLAERIGNEIDTFGLFNIYVWDDDTDISRSKSRKFLAKFPTRIRTAPSIINTARNSEGEKINILTYEEGDIIIKSIAVQIDSDIAKQMLDVVFNAYLPKSIPYDKIYNYWTRVNKFNGVVPQTNESILKIIISEICRDPNDLSRPFRHYLRDCIRSHNNKIDMLSRKMLNIRNIPRYNSTFASVTSGNPKSGITSSITRTRSGRIEKESPIEKAIE